MSRVSLKVAAALCMSKTCSLAAIDAPTVLRLYASHGPSRAGSPGDFSLLTFWGKHWGLARLGLHLPTDPLALLAVCTRTCQCSHRLSHDACDIFRPGFFVLLGRINLRQALQELLRNWPVHITRDNLRVVMHILYP